MKTLILTPPSKNTIKEPPLGAASICAFLEKEGFDTGLYDFAESELTLEGIRQVLIEEKPQIVGISFLSSARFPAFEIARIAKSLGIITVAGGHHATFTAQEIILNYPFFDFVVRGEGEFTFLELLKELNSGKKEFDKIKGISYRQGDKVKTTQERDFIADLDSLPFPAWHLLKMDKYPYHTIMGSRGCCSECIFCSSPDFWKRRLRLISPKRVVDSLELLVKKYGRKLIRFRDDYFTLNQHWAWDVCEEIIRKGLKIKWECQGMAIGNKKSLFEQMKKAGCEKICFGIESGSQKVLSSIKKNINKESIYESVTLAREAGIKLVGTFFMLGHPQETIEDMRQTFEFAGQLKADLVTFKPTEIYPGTEIFQIAKREGILSDFNWQKRNQFKPFFSITEEIPVYLPKDFTRKMLSQTAKDFYLKSFFFRLKRLESIGELNYFFQTQWGISFNRSDIRFFIKRYLKEANANNLFENISLFFKVIFIFLSKLIYIGNRKIRFFFKKGSIYD